MNLPELPLPDIHSGVVMFVAIAGFFSFIFLVFGIRSLRKAQKLKFFRMRRDRVMGGWRMILSALGLAALALVTNQFAEPAIYTFYPPTVTLTPSPTITITPTITQTPTITLSPTVTDTPSQTNTPTITPTPHIPLAIEMEFSSSATPNPDVVLSPIVFAQQLDEDYLPVDPTTVFQNPVGHMYAWFSYDKMNSGAQWSALWVRDGSLVHYETKPWDGSTGGIGYSDWQPPAELWLPGVYQVQIFIGMEWKVSADFTVEGAPPTPVGTPTPTFTLTPTITRTPTPTPRATQTPTPSKTLTPTFGPSPTSTPKPATATRRPTDTSIPTRTSTPVTPSPTLAPSPTRTPTVVTPSATLAPTATRTRPAPTATLAPTKKP